MKKLLLTLLLLFSVGMVAMAAETVELTVSGSAFIGSDNITVSIDKANGGTAPRWDATYVRVYAKNTITIKGAEGITITKVVFSTESSNGTFLKGASSNKGTFNGTSKTWTGSENSFVITNGTVTSGHTRINKITVTYEEETAGPKEPKDFTGFDKLAEEGVALYVGKSMDINLPANAPEITYQSSNAEVAKVENGSIVALAVGEAEIVASWNLVAETWNAGEKTFKVVVMEVPEFQTAAFDFINDWGSVFTSWPSGDVSDKNSNATATVGDATIKASGKFTIFQSNAQATKGEHTLRLYKESTSADAGSITLSVTEGFYITKIDMTFDGTQYIKFTEAYTNTDPSVTSMTYTTTTGTTKIKTITVEYAKLPENVLDSKSVDVHLYSGTGRVGVTYTIAVANWNGGELETAVEVLVGDNKVEATPYYPTTKPAAAPEMAAAENKTFSNTLYFEAPELKNADKSQVAVNFSASIDGKELFAESVAPKTSTGIEDVTVEGNETAEYYNLQGLRVAQPEAGQLYIKRQAGKAVKVRF